MRCEGIVVKRSELLQLPTKLPILQKNLLSRPREILAPGLEGHVEEVIGGRLREGSLPTPITTLQTLPTPPEIIFPRIRPILWF